MKDGEASLDNRPLFPNNTQAIPGHDQTDVKDYDPMRFTLILLSALVLLLLTVSPHAQQSAGKKPTDNPFASARPYLIALSVKDVPASQKWYVESFGFRVVKPAASVAPKTWFAQLELNDFQLELIGIEQSAPRRGALPNPQNAASLQGICKFAFLVGDLDEAARALQAKGVSLKMKPTTNEEFGVKFFLLEDPDQNVIQVFQKLSAK